MKRTFWLTALAYLAVYLVSFALLFGAQSVRLNRNDGLIGEDLASAYRNVYLLPLHIQNDGFATNFSGTVYFWLGSYLLPLSVASQGLFKIISMAFFPLILILLMRTVRPATAWPTLLLSALLLATIPPLSWYSIMTAEYALDCVYAFFSLWLAFNFSWHDPPGRLSGRLCLLGLSIIWFANLYPTCLIIALIIPLLLGVRIWTEKPAAAGRHAWGPLQRSLCWLTFVSLTFLGTLWPKWYFGPQVTIFTGGGKPTLDWASLANSWSYMISDLFIKPVSYLANGDILIPAWPYWLTGGPLLLLALAGCWLLWREKNRFAVWLLLIAGSSFGLGLFAGVNPGIRRIFPFVVVMVIAAGFGLEQLSKGRRTRPAYWALVIFLLGSSLFLFWQTYAYVAVSFRPWLQREFTYLPGKNYAGTVETLVGMSQRGPLKLRGCVAGTLPLTPALEKFIQTHEQREVYGSGKYLYDSWRNSLVLEGEMTGAEKYELYRLYPGSAARRSIDRLYAASQGYLFYHRDTALMLRLFCQRRGLPDKNIIFTE